MEAYNHYDYDYDLIQLFINNWIYHEFIFFKKKFKKRIVLSAAIVKTPMNFKCWIKPLIVFLQLVST